MKLARVTILVCLAAGWPASAQTPTWDSSGNSMLKGTYYFRETIYIPQDAYGDLNEAIALYGNITFDGNGNYTMSGSAFDSNVGAQQTIPPTKGTYVIAASGYGYVSSLFSTSTTTYDIYGLVSQQGIFIGSATESYADLFIAAPVSSPAATVSAFKGSYWIADMDLSGATPTYTISSMFQLNPDGAGNLGNVTLTGYIGGAGASVVTQAVSALKYTFQSGAGVIAFPNPSNATTLIAGQKYMYISPDGKFVFGGSPTSWDMFVGVQMGSGTPPFSGLYYQAGINEDTSTLANGYATLDTYYGALSAPGGPLVGHQRLQYNSASAGTIGTYGYTYSDTFTPNSSGTYANSVMKYAVSGDGAVRIGSGIGPELGINVALAAPSVTGPGSGVYIYPQYVVNAASYAPFTAGVAPGEVLTLAGQNLASSPQSFSTLPFPTTLGNVQVKVNGLASPLISVSPTQVSFLVPYEVTTSLASIQLTTGESTSNTVTLPVNLTGPGVFTFQQNGIGSAAALHADYSFVNSASPAQPGEIIQVYLTGLGAVTPTVPDGAAGPSNPLSNTTNTISAYINGETATVSYQGLAPGLGGLYQVNLTVPTDLTTGNYYLDIAGPDSYTSEATLAVGTSTTASAQPAALGHQLRRHR